MKTVKTLKVKLAILQVRLEKDVTAKDADGCADVAYVAEELGIRIEEHIEALCHQLADEMLGGSRYQPRRLDMAKTRATLASALRYAGAYREVARLAEDASRWANRFMNVEVSR